MPASDLLWSQFQGCEKGQSFATITRLLNHFDNPQHRLPPVIHIAGTNGKGSTAAFVSAALMAAGFKVHRLISPHLCTMTERITLANRPIDYDVMASHLMEIARLTDGKISCLEAVTATALYLFSCVPADAVVLEVGVGGLYDGTNVVVSTCVSVITPISLDHQALLGPTCADIALQKSGIMRLGVPCVSAPQMPCVQDVLTQQAGIRGSTLYASGKEWFFQPKGRGFCIQYGDSKDEAEFPVVGLEGTHQRMNAAVAAMALHVQSALFVPYSAIAYGLGHAVWPGRLQRITLNPQHTDRDDEVWIDGAHNAGGFVLLAEHIRAQGWLDPESDPLMVVFGSLPKKNPSSFWTQLAPMADQVCVIESWRNQMGTPLSAMQQFCDPVNDDFSVVHGFVTLDLFLQAVKEKKWGPQRRRILICGSLNLIGDILSTIQHQ